MMGCTFLEVLEVGFGEALLHYVDDYLIDFLVEGGLVGEDFEAFLLH